MRAPWILSDHGNVSVGVTGDDDTVPDVARLCRSIESGIDDLHEQASRSTGPPE